MITVCPSHCAQGTNPNEGAREDGRDNRHVRARGTRGRTVREQIERRLRDLRLIRPVIFLRGLPAMVGSLRRSQADSRAGSTRDQQKPAVVMSNTYADLRVFYGSDGTRTRDLRRDRPARRSRLQSAGTCTSAYLPIHGDSSPISVGRVIPADGHGAGHRLPARVSYLRPRHRSASAPGLLEAQSLVSGLLQRTRNRHRKKGPRCRANSSARLSS